MQINQKRDKICVLTVSHRNDTFTERKNRLSKRKTYTEGFSHIPTYLRKLSTKEYKLPTSILQSTLSSAFLSSSVHLLFILLISVSIYRRNLFSGLPFLLWSSGFHVRACLVIQLGACLNVRLIHSQTSS